MQLQSIFLAISLHGQLTDKTLLQFFLTGRKFQIYNPNWCLQSDADFYWSGISLEITLKTIFRLGVTLGPISTEKCA